MAKTIFVEVVGNASQFKKELTGAVAATSKANSGFQRMGKVAGVAGGILATGLAFGLEKSVKAAMSAEESSARLDQAFKNAGLSAKNYANRLVDAEAAGRKLGFTNTETRDSLGSLITATGSYSQAIKIESTAIDVARFKHIDLEAATKTMTMAMAGSKRALTALGVPLIAVTSNMDALKRSNMDLSTAAGIAAKKHAQLLDKMATGQAILKETADKLHGVGAAFADTSAGKAQVFKAQVDNLKESLGDHLLPALRHVINGLNDFADFLSKHTTIAAGLAAGLGLLAGALLALSAASTIAAAGMSAFWIAATAGLIVAVPALIVGILELIRHFDAIKAALASLGAWISSHAMVLLAVPIVGAMLFVAVEVAKHWNTIKATFTGALNAIRAVVVGAMTAISGAVTSALATIRGIFVSGWAAITGAVHAGTAAVTSAVEAMTSAVTALIHALVGVWNALRAAAARIIKFLVDTGALGSALGVIHALEAAWNALRAAASHVIHFITSTTTATSPSSSGIPPRSGGRARGGRVFAGVPYMVGELGPEMFMPGSGGTIVPTNRLAGVGGGDVYVTVNMPHYLGSRQEVARAFRDELQLIDNRNGRIFKGA